MSIYTVCGLKSTHVLMNVYDDSTSDLQGDKWKRLEGKCQAGRTLPVYSHLNTIECSEVYDLTVFNLNFLNFKTKV